MNNKQNAADCIHYHLKCHGGNPWHRFISVRFCIDEAPVSTVRAPVH